MALTQRWCWVVCVGVAAASISACTTMASPNERIFRSDAPKMSAIYAAGMDGGASPRAQAIVSNNPDPGVDALRGYTREAQTEIDNLFPTAPNPQLVMFVFPHLTPQGVPVPGFATPLKLYERNYYLLPGELE